MISSFLENAEDIVIDRQKETLSFYEVNLTVPYEWSSLSGLIDNCKSFSIRDSWEFSIVIDGESKSIIDLTRASKDALQVFFKDALDDVTSIKARIKITKKLVGNVLSVYSLESFADFLVQESFKTVFSEINKYFSTKLVFEVFELIDSFGSKSIQFVSNGEADNIVDSVDGTEILSTFKDLCSHDFKSVKINPIDFHLIKRSELTSLNSVFDNLCKILSLTYISDRIETQSENILRFKINGYKSFELEVDFKAIDLDQDGYLYKIFLWVYEESKSVDKIGLVRNVLSLHYEANRLSINVDCWVAIKSNYEIYLKENISQYIEIKNKIVEFIEESSSKTNSIVDSFSESFRKNTIAILTFFISVFLIKGLKSNGFSSFVTEDNLMVLFILSVLSFIWLYISHENVKRRTNHRLDDFKDLLLNNYKNILDEDEITGAVDPVLKSNRDFLNSQVKFFTGWWIAVNSIVVITFILCLSIKISNSYSTDNTLGKVNQIRQKVNTQPSKKTTPLKPTGQPGTP